MTIAASDERLAALRAHARDVLTGNWRSGRLADGTEYGFSCPSPPRYRHQWYWDSCFHAIVWRHFDPLRARVELRTLLRAGRLDGFIPHTVFWHDAAGWRRAPFYATHTRRRDEGAADAVAEAIRVGRAAGVRLQVSHLVPRNGIAESRRCIELVETARDAGQDVAFDMHTRTFGLTNLYAALPAWALAAEPAELAAILRDRTKRDDMRGYRSILSAGNDWSRVVLLDNEIWPEHGRRDLAAIAAERAQEPLDAVYDLLLAGVDELHRLMVIIHAYSEDQQREAFAHRLCVPGSDATTLAPDGMLGESFFHGAYTWAAWFWRFTVREERLLTPEEGVHRLTGRPAERIGLTDRGVLREGARADVAVFDPRAFAERGTVFEPNLLAEGMRHVLVNGVATLRDGALTGERAGMVLRR
jgi:N-acyl-D-aspartate/D-glutamate deacylase